MSITFDTEYRFDPVTQTVKFCAHTGGQKVHCSVSRLALEMFSKVGNLTVPELENLFCEQRELIESRAAMKIRSHRYEGADKIYIKAADLR